MVETQNRADRAVNRPWTGRGSLRDLVAELDRQKATKLDFVADTRHMMIEVETETDGTDGITHRLKLTPKHNAAQLREFMPAEGLAIRDTALQQLGDKQEPNVPWSFLQKLRSVKPFTTADLLNDLLADPNRRLVRCLDGQVRAFLSDRYRVLDNYDLAFTSLDVCRESGGQVIEASLSDRYMRLKFTTQDVWDSLAEMEGKHGRGSHEWIGRIGWSPNGRELPGGPGTVHPVVTITNSETGHGGLSVQIGILRAACVNLAIVEDVQSQIHLGGKLDIGVYAEETIAADSQVVMLKCRDAIKAAFTPERFRSIVDRCRAANDVPVRAPAAAIGNVIANTALPESARDLILAHFLADYAPTAYGLAQAVARYAQDVADADDAAAVEEAAGHVLTHPGLVTVEA